MAYSNLLNWLHNSIMGQDNWNKGQEFNVLTQLHISCQYHEFLMDFTQTFTIGYFWDNQNKG